MLDHLTEPVNADSIRTQHLDAPVGADTLRVEPICDTPIFVDVRRTIHWLDREPEVITARLTTGGKKQPCATSPFRRPLDGVKVEVEIIPVDGKATVGLRTVCGERDKLPPVREQTKGK